MADFKTALAFVLRNEDPKLSGVVTEDEGGRTRFGIAEKYHADLGDSFYKGKRDDALETAEKIYRADYWCGDSITCQHLANKLLDIAVNSGFIHAVQTAQRAVNALLQRDELITDGKMGPKSLAAINAQDCEQLIAITRTLMEQFYRHIAANRPNSERELESWLARNKE